MHFNGAAMTDPLTRRAAISLTAAALAASLPAGRLFSKGTGPVVLLSGCSSGFGRLGALAFARAGYRTVATMRRLASDHADAAAALGAVAADEGLDLALLEIDVADDASVADGVAAAEHLFGRIDILVSNAGIGIPLPAEMSHDATREVMETNFHGALRMVHAVLPGMRARGAGLLIQVTSGLGRYSLPLYGAYTASKHALEAMFDALAYELHPFGIETALVQPGGYDTRFKENARADHERYLAALDPALTTVYADHLDATRNILRHVETPPAQQIADAIVALAGMPPGERPLRIAEGPGLDRIAAINDPLEAALRRSTRTYLRRPDWTTLG